MGTHFKCSGCNSCNLQNPLQIKLTAFQVAYLKEVDLVQRFNETIAKPQGRSPAKLIKNSLVLGRAAHLSLIAEIIPMSDRDRIEVRGIRQAFLECLRAGVIIFPMSPTEESIFHRMIDEIGCHDSVSPKNSDPFELFDEFALS